MHFWQAVKVVFRLLVSHAQSKKSMIKEGLSLFSQWERPTFMMRKHELLSSPIDTAFLL